MSREDGKMGGKMMEKIQKEKCLWEPSAQQKKSKNHVLNSFLRAFSEVFKKIYTFFVIISFSPAKILQRQHAMPLAFFFLI